MQFANQINRFGVLLRLKKVKNLKSFDLRFFVASSIKIEEEISNMRITVGQFDPNSTTLNTCNLLKAPFVTKI